MRHPQSYDFLSSVLEIKMDEWKNSQPPKMTAEGEPARMDDTLLITACVGALGDLGDARALPIVKEF